LPAERKKMAIVINAYAIENRKKFKEIICFNCGLCENKETKAAWCWPKFIENRGDFVKYFVNRVVNAKAEINRNPYTFRGPEKFRELFCSPDKGACYLSYGCQGVMARCYNSFYAQIIGLPNRFAHSRYSRSSQVEDYDKLCGYRGPIVDAEYIEVKKDDEPFIFSSTGKRFLNKVEKILEDRNKPKHRARKSASKTRAPTKAGSDNSEPAVLRGKKRR
jgi:hypothetical protein